MKRVIGLLLAILLLPSLGIAQAPPYIRNDSLASINGPNLGTGSASVDVKGQLFVGAIVPGTGATNLGKAESGLHTSGDVGVQALGVTNTSQITFSGDGYYSPIATSPRGETLSVPIYNSAYGNSINGLKAEDSAAASGDALVGVAGVANTGFATNAANGDYLSPALDTTGAAFSIVTAQTNASVLTTPARYEDSAVADTQAVMLSGSITQDPLSVDQGASGDVALIKTDRAGRTITTLAPAGETFSVCSDFETGVADNVIKAAVASNRIYITALSCVNTSAVSSTISFRDNTTLIWQGAVTSSTLAGVGQFNMTFPVPLRGSVNTVFQYLMGTTATNTSCCASGYISVN